MTVKQYVGARYVPKFHENSQNASLNTWEADTAYEALTIVTYNNSSYTSKIPVPASIGNPAQNPTYWSNTGNYNAQVEAYREETVSVREELTQTQSDIANETQARELADTNLTNYINQQTKWSKRVVLAVGDSYGDESICPNSWATLLRSLLGIPEANYHNLCVSGNNFQGYLSEITNYSGDKNSVTDIIVAGGLNDSDNDTAENMTAYLTPLIVNFAEYAKNNYPNAKLWLAYIGSGIDNGTGISQTNRTYLKRFLAAWGYKTYGTQEGFTYIDGCEYILNCATSLFQEDGAHPNNYGSKRLAEGIYNALTGGTAFPTYPYIEAYNLFFYSVNGGTTTFANAGDILADVPAEKSLSHNFVDIFPEMNMYCTFNRPLYVPVMLVVNHTTEADNLIVPADLKIENKTLSIRINKISSDGTGFDTLTKKEDQSNMQILIPPFTVSFSTMFI